MSYKRPLLIAGLLAAALSCSQGPAETPHQQAPPAKPFYSQLNDQARAERKGDLTAIPVIARGAFENAGIPSAIPDAFGFTNRIVQAQQNYRAGIQPPLREEDVVRAWNNFASALGTPEWTRTTQPEVRKLRMRMLAVLPQLFACQDPPDATGHYRVLSPSLSPLEASFLTVTLIHMKTFNGEFQFTDAERGWAEQLDPAARAAAERDRTKTLLDIAMGRSGTTNVLGLLVAGRHLFSDLGIADSENSAVAQPHSAKTRATTQKGGL